MAEPLPNTCRARRNCNALLLQAELAALAATLKASNAAAAGSAAARQACEAQLLPVKLREENLEEMQAQHRNGILMLEQLRVSAAKHVADAEALSDARALASTAARRTKALAERAQMNEDLVEQSSEALRATKKELARLRSNEQSGRPFVEGGAGPGYSALTAKQPAATLDSG